MGVKAALVFASATLAAVVAVSAAQDTSVERGEQIANAACLGCHDFRPIETLAMDKDGWATVVSSMVNKGADVTNNDRPVLIDYLVKHYGPLPAGPGQSLLLNNCTICHDLGRVRAHTVSREEWEETLRAMLNEGAMLSDADFKTLLDYLAKNFKPQ